MGLVKEFKEFAMKGNVVDLAVGVIIGGAFGGIVSSLVNDVIMPPIGKLIGNMDFSNLYIPLYSMPAGTEAPKTLLEAKKLGSVVAYGNFLTILINFIILAFVIFMMIKLMNRAMRKEKAAEAAAAPPAPPADVLLLTEIRDILKTK